MLIWRDARMRHGCRMIRGLLVSNPLGLSETLDSMCSIQRHNIDLNTPTQILLKWKCLLSHATMGHVRGVSGRIGTDMERINPKNIMSRVIRFYSTAVCKNNFWPTICTRHLPELLLCESTNSISFLPKAEEKRKWWKKKCGEWKTKRNCYGTLMKQWNNNEANYRKRFAVHSQQECLKVISGLHRALLQSVTFISRLMHSIIQNVDVKIHVI